MGTTLKNIALNVQKKETFVINDDESKTIELLTSDMGIVSRFSESIDAINKLVASLDSLSYDSESEDSEASFVQFGKDFKELDHKMCDIIDYIFDYPVSEVCTYGGTMFDLMDGQFRFETIIDTLFQLYDNTINTESAKLKKRIESHTDKYIPKDHKRKSTK